MNGEGSAAAVDGADPPSARADLAWSLAWIAVGMAIFYGGFAMDRLERQNINPYTAPGLVPAALGIGIALLGALLLIRSIRRGDAATCGRAAPPDYGRLAMALVLCLGYAAGLVGRGLPFWAATSAFVFVSIAALQWRERGAHGGRLRGLLVAAACAAGTAAGVTFVFQEIFLVRLP